VYCSRPAFCVRPTIAGIGRCCSNPTARYIMCYSYCLENIYRIPMGLVPPTASEPMNKLSKPSSFRRLPCESNQLCHEALPYEASPLSRPSAPNHSPNAGCSAGSESNPVPAANWMSYLLQIVYLDGILVVLQSAMGGGGFLCAKTLAISIRG